MLRLLSNITFSEPIIKDIQPLLCLVQKLTNPAYSLCSFTFKKYS